MPAKKVSVVEPAKAEPSAAELGEFSPPLESPAEIKAKVLAEREAEQQKLDREWQRIPYVDQKDLQPGYYCGYELNDLFKHWRKVKQHPHDFYKCSRQLRPHDLAKHYESDELLKRHDRLVFELEAWRKREALKDDMRIQLRKMYEIQKERVRYQKLRKEIRAEQLRYESTLRWPLSPHAVRHEFDTDEEEGSIPELEKEAEIAAGLPVEDMSGPEAPSSEGDQEQRKPARKKKAAAPRMRYSLFHYDIPRRLKRVSIKGPFEPLPEYSTSPGKARTPAWNKGKARNTDEMAQLVIDLETWEEKIPGGGVKA